MFVIRTGVPSVDELLHQRNPRKPFERGIQLPDAKTSTSFCIVGPDGAGKSVLAMHLVSRYLADCIAGGTADADLPHAFYISSDLSYPVAQRMWINFALHAPNARCIPYQHPQYRDAAAPDWFDVKSPKPFAPELRLALRLYGTGNPAVLAEHLHGGHRLTSGEHPGVAFVDLASTTAGDDWAFIHRLLAVLPIPPASEPRHLMVIDAVEGLETFGGDLDAFGQQTTRRARIAKLMRLSAGKCHVVLIIEEPVEGTRLPEQFVADVVIRLRSTDAHGYMRRTIEIEKARGQPNIRGRHPYVIRPGTGSTTGEQQNADDPRLLYDENLQDEDTASLALPDDYEWPEHQSYVLTFPSVHQVSRAIMEDVGKGRQPPADQRAGFGIHYLDQMLSESKPEWKEEEDRGDERGLPCSTVTALIGDAGTQKTGLGIAFLGHAFSEAIKRMAQARLKPPRRSPADIVRAFEGHAGVAVLLTTHDESQEMLAKCFLQHLRKNADIRAFVEDDRARAALVEMFTRRTICRRLEIHDTPPAVLLNTIRRAAEAAQQIKIAGEADSMSEVGLPEKAEVRFAQSWSIRLVIDDFSTIMDTYAQLRTDQLFLPFLLFYLRREGVTSLIEDTRAGGPYTPMEGFHTDLRALTDHRIYTWHVTDFYGDHRVAIAPIPPVSRNLGVVVRELRRNSPLPSAAEEQDAFRPKGNLDVDLRFELYAGLEENKPRPVPLRVRLYAETEACRQYASYLNSVLNDVFTPVPSALKEERPAIVVTEDPQYDRLRDLSVLLADNRLDYTLVFQVDEFWMGKATFRNEQDYLWEARVALNGDTVDANLDDPYKTYRQLQLAREPRSPIKAIAGKQAGATGSRLDIRRGDFFDVPGCDLDDPEVDRIPYAVDFGFLEYRQVPWQHAALDKKASDVVNRVWNTTDQAPNPDQSWRDVLEAACRVAAFDSEERDAPVPAFDLSMLAPESFSCLVLEVWCSEILRTLSRLDHAGEANAFAERLGTRSWEPRREGLLDWFTARRPVPLAARLRSRFPGYTYELYKAWLLLVEALDLRSLQEAPGVFAFKSGRLAHPLAVCSRQWYKTATAPHAPDDRGSGLRTYGRLPGSFTTRGDWFLAVASGSRSNRLGNRIVDLLCSLRGNARRMRLGIGLPPRRMLKNPKRDAKRLRTALRTGPTGTGVRLTYEDVLALGAGAGPRDDHAATFGWLWRSSLRDYQRQNSMWLGWLYRMLRRSQVLREDPAKWESGFAVYDELTKSEATGDLPREITGLASYREFPGLCKDFVAELQQVSQR